MRLANKTKTTITTLMAATMAAVQSEIQLATESNDPSRVETVSQLETSLADLKLTMSTLETSRLSGLQSVVIERQRVVDDLTHQLKTARTSLRNAEVNVRRAQKGLGAGVSIVLPSSPRKSGGRRTPQPNPNPAPFTATVAYRPYILLSLQLLGGHAHYRDAQELTKFFMTKAGIFKPADEDTTDFNTRPRWLAMSSSLRQTLIRNQVLVSEPNGMDQMTQSGQDELFAWAKEHKLDVDAQYKVYDRSKDPVVVEIRGRYKDKPIPDPRPNGGRHKAATAVK